MLMRRDQWSRSGDRHRGEGGGEGSWVSGLRYEFINPGTACTALPLADAQSLSVSCMVTKPRKCANNLATPLGLDH
eukprot:6306700-Prymnesium_polylepis.1